jgi:predicted nucleotidyltransferase
LTPFQLQHVYFREQSAGSRQTPGGTSGQAIASFSSAIHKLFVEGCLAQGKTREEAQRLWDEDTRKREATKETRKRELEAQREAAKAQATESWKKRRASDRLRQLEQAAQRKPKS